MLSVSCLTPRSTLTFVIKMVVKPARARSREREGLPGITLARSIHYLGVDLLSTHVALRVVTDRRATDFIDRCRFVSLTHWTQRSGLIADSMAANWLSAGFQRHSALCK